MIKISIIIFTALFLQIKQNVYKMEDGLIQIDPEMYILCRLCLEERGKFQIVPKIQEDIKYALDIDVKLFDGYSQVLCDKCKTLVADIRSTKLKYKSKQKIMFSKNNSDHSVQRQESSSPIVENTPRVPKLTIKIPRKNFVVLSSSSEDEDSSSVENIDHISVSSKASTAELINTASDSCIIDQNQDHMEDESWQSRYRRKFVCRYCNYQLCSKIDLKDHIVKHGILISKRRKLSRIHSTVRLTKINNSCNLTGSDKFCVLNINKVVRDDLNADYYILYTAKCDDVFKIAEETTEDVINKKFINEDKTNQYDNTTTLQSNTQKQSHEESTEGKKADSNYELDDDITVTKENFLELGSVLGQKQNLNNYNELENIIVPYDEVINNKNKFVDISQYIENSDLNKSVITSQKLKNRNERIQTLLNISNYLENDSSKNKRVPKNMTKNLSSNTELCKQFDSANNHKQTKPIENNVTGGLEGFKSYTTLEYQIKPTLNMSKKKSSVLPLTNLISQLAPDSSHLSNASDSVNTNTVNSSIGLREKHANEVETSIKSDRSKYLLNETPVSNPKQITKKKSINNSEYYRGSILKSKYNTESIWKDSNLNNNTSKINLTTPSEVSHVSTSIMNNASEMLVTTSAPSLIGPNEKNIVENLTTEVIFPRIKVKSLSELKPEQLVENNSLSFDRKLKTPINFVNQSTPITKTIEVGASSIVPSFNTLTTSTRPVMQSSKVVFPSNISPSSTYSTTAQSVFQDPGLTASSFDQPGNIFSTSADSALQSDAVSSFVPSSITFPESVIQSSNLMFPNNITSSNTVSTTAQSVFLVTEYVSPGVVPTSNIFSTPTQSVSQATEIMFPSILPRNNTFPAAPSAQQTTKEVPPGYLVLHTTPNNITSSNTVSTTAQSVFQVTEYVSPSVVPTSNIFSTPTQSVSQATEIMFPSILPRSNTFPAAPSAQQATKEVPPGYLVLHTTTLPRTLTNQPVGYFAQLLQFHRLELITNTRLTENFVNLTTYCLGVDQYSGEAICISLDAFLNTYSLFITSGSNILVVSKMSAYWQWEVLISLKSARTMENAIRSARGGRLDGLRLFFNLLSSIKLLADNFNSN